MMTMSFRKVQRLRGVITDPTFLNLLKSTLLVYFEVGLLHHVDASEFKATCFGVHTW